MMKWLVLAFFFSHQALALEAVVTVLEAPLFKAKNLDSPVVQYLRKGDVLKVHPSLNNETRYQHLAPSPEKLAALKKKMMESPEYKDDPLFRGEAANTYSLDDEFIPTLDRQGKEVFILSSHIYVYLNNNHELTQSPNGADPTDYRLQEPLAKNYPLNSVTGYRGQVLLGFTQVYSESYPYSANAKTKGYQTPVDFSLNFLRQATIDNQDRLFFGVTLNVRYFENRYSLVNGRKSSETGTRLGLGPVISYDAFKGTENRVNLFGSVTVSPFNQISITQSGEAGSDSRNYQAYSISPRMGIQYHRKSILKDVDFVLGTLVELEFPTVYRSSQKVQVPAYWKRAGSDHFTTRTTFNLAGFIGFQSAY